MRASFESGNIFRTSCIEISIWKKLRIFGRTFLNSRNSATYNIVQCSEFLKLKRNFMFCVFALISGANISNANIKFKAIQRNCKQIEPLKTPRKPHLEFINWVYLHRKIYIYQQLHPINSHTSVVLRIFCWHNLLRCVYSITSQLHMYSMLSYL